MKRTSPKSVFEVVVRLDKGPDSQGRYDYKSFWLDAYSPDQKVSTRADGLFVRSRPYFGDPSEQWIGKRGKMTRIVDLTGSWKGKLVYP